MQGILNGVTFDIPSGLASGKWALFLCSFSHAEKTAKATLVGFFDDPADAKKIANQRFGEFHPGMAMLQSTETGETWKAHNWNHDTLTWEMFHKGDSK